MTGRGELHSVSGDFQAVDLIDVMDSAERYNTFLLDQVLSLTRRGDVVLDFGAGNGRFATALHERGVAIHAVEPDRSLRERIVARGVPAAASLETITVQQFDCVYSLNVLEHIEDDRGILEQLAARLRPGGRLLLFVPAFAVLYSSNDARVGHVRRYSRRALVDVVRNAGLQVADVRYVDSLGFVAALLYRWFGSRDGDLSVASVRLYDGFVFPLSRMLDRVFDRVGGKNLLLRAQRPL